MPAGAGVQGTNHAIYQANGARELRLLLVRDSSRGDMEATIAGLWASRLGL